MPNLNDILSEANAAGSGLDLIRRKYIRELADYTGRNVIVYYSGWLQKPIAQLQAVLAVNDNDKNGFMATIHQLDRTLGLDLVLHTPGGDTAAHRIHCRISSSDVRLEYSGIHSSTGHVSGYYDGSRVQGSVYGQALEPRAN